MYVREAKKREEVWLLDRLEEFGFEDPAFRSRDYVFAMDEDAGETIGFGRLRTHAGEDGFCEVTCIGVLPDWRGHGAGAAILDRLFDDAEAQGIGTVHAFTDVPDYFEQFGFELVDEAALADAQRERLKEVREWLPEAVAMAVSVGEFGIPRRLYRRFSGADEDVEERPEDFGIDPETTTYKYDTGRRR